MSGTFKAGQKVKIAKGLDFIFGDVIGELNGIVDGLYKVRKEDGEVSYVHESILKKK